MEITLNEPRVFPVGTTVKAYAASNWPGGQAPKGAPKGASVAEAVVAADGTLKFTGVNSKIRYWAAAEVGGEYRYVQFTPTLAKSASANATPLSVSASGAAFALPAPGEHLVVDLTVSANLVLTPGSFAPGDFQTIWLRQGAGGPYTITVNGVEWGYGAAPIFTPAAAAIDVFSLGSPDGILICGFPGGYEFK